MRISIRFIAITTISLAIVLSFASAAAEENPSPYAEAKVNPALQRFGRSIILYVSFDNHEKAEITQGNPAPQGDAKWAEAAKNLATLYTPGVCGQGLKSGDYGLAYSCANAVLGSSGSFALWIKPEVLNHKGAYYWPVNLQAAKGGYGVMVGRMGDPRNKERLYAHLAGTSACWHGGMDAWNPGEWHLLVVNWDRSGVEFSVDGKTPVRETLKTPLKSDAAGGMTLRLSGAGEDVFVFDELIVMDVPLKEKEIRWLYETGKRGCEP